MATRETPSAKIERLLAAGDDAGALKASNDLLAQAPNSFLGIFGRARANFRLSNLIEAQADVALALRLSPNDEGARLLRANLDMRLGRLDEANEILLPLSKGRGPHAIDAQLFLLQNHFNAGRNDALAAMVKAGGAWTQDPRAAIFHARAKALEDATAGIELLKGVFRSRQPAMLRRLAGFEAVGYLDKAARYREAFDLAKEVHLATDEPVDMQAWNAPLENQLRLLEKGRAHFRPRGPSEPGTAFVVALPRSGTTLLEQMLDRHPAIGGIGEFDGVDSIALGLHATGRWPRTPELVPDSTFEELRRHYLVGSAELRKPGATWTFDKNLRTWRALCEVATVFPGAVCIGVDRDPRDVAISILLHYFNPKSFDWAGSLANIRTIIGWQRRIVPRAFEALELPHEAIVYEDLVEDPAGHAERCLARMGLAMDERVLSPEQNPKAAVTLSHAQVRQPINRKSIGRWRNYEWAFDSSWDELVAAHDARRKFR